MRTRYGGIARYRRAASSDGAFLAWVNANPLNEWSPFANSENSLIDPNPPVPTNGFDQPAFLSGPKEKIEAWGSLAWDELSRSWILFGGGHNNYAGNEVQQWNANRAAPRWEQLKAPVTDPALLVSGVQNFANGTPNSPHGYFNNFVLSRRRLFIAHGLSAVWYNAAVHHVIAVFDLDTKTWWDPADWPSAPECAGFAISKCQHPETGDIYYLPPSGKLYCTRESDLTTTQIGSTILDGNAAESPCCIDPRTNTMWLWHQELNEWWKIDLATGVKTEVTLSGASGWEVESMGSTWDSDQDRLLFATHNADVYAIDPDTSGAAELAIGGTKPLGPSTGVARLYNKIAYSPSCKGFFFCNRADRPVYHVRTVVA